MKSVIYKVSLIFFISFWFQNTQAQDPNWFVNSSNYQYSMTFTTFLNVDGSNLTSENDKVAAFVNGEVRGVANIIYEASVQKYVAYLSVYANTNNETISFKIYNSTADLVVNIDRTETFSIDGNMGGIFQSYSIASPELNENAIFSSFNFLGITAVAEEITSDKINIVLPENTDVRALSAVFVSSENSAVYVDGVMQISGVSKHSFTNPVIYKVLSENQAVLKEYEVSVSLALNSDPVTVAISTTNNLKTNSIPVTLNISFSKVVSGFDISDFLLENAIISEFSTEDSKVFKINLIPMSQGDFSIQVAANSALDENNNQNEISNKIIFTYDITKPIITNIAVDNDANAWWFLVTFNEEVLNIDVSDFEIKGIASNGMTISSINLVENNQYKISVSNTNLEEGTISLQVKSASDIKDFSSNSIVFSEYEAYFIPKKPITITADVKSKIYGETDPELTYTITTGSLENGDVFTGNLTREAGEDVGDYIISSTLSNHNYDITFVSNNLSIVQKEITITADVKSKIYGATDPELTYTITTGSLENGDVFTGNLTRVIGEEIGDYAISSTLSNNNYDITFVSNNFSIVQKEITITADVKSKIYGAADPELTYTITTGSLENGDVFTGNLTRVAGEDVGDYIISSTLSNNNYDITFVSNNLSIVQKEITITADVKSKIYGATDPELTYTITTGSIENGDVFTGNLTREAGEDVGEHAISSTLSNNNYDITFVSNNLSIVQKEITITADVKSKIYGETDPELTYTVTTGSIENGDVFTGNLTREAGEDVGEYAISSTLSNDNYDITFVSNNLSIVQREITITADAKSKIYGETDPELTYTITTGSLENGDVFTGNLTREAGEDVGEYAISSTLSNNNYDITFVSNNLSIVQKEITITADVKSKVYGETDPELTYTITTGSLENGDVFTGNLTREAGEDVGEYAISSTLSSNNYDITFESNNLSIVQREITVTADIKTKNFGDSDPVLTYQITEGSLINNDNFTGVLIREVGEYVGVYLIEIGTLSLSNNYNITFIGANFEISTTASLDDISLTNRIKIFPNPVNFFLNVETSNQLEIKKVIVLSLLGKVLINEKNVSKGIQLQSLSAGTYIIKIITNQGIVTKRILKK
ncbi:T9SS type A sorting domain-containing protein [Polaribacter litorisediminis]|uniref:MBG domain-containing protein n=1 Tax=Polaribacter litorisediminis TaxID=1908341 RepID=UPI001CBD788D|nr:MBG domain-containing protein [Polaribacter litorisediminis]UAM98360.1 T9SS type A sorting domain-containing protein [Polaribacter litorisediminis]